jgi:hypothetical protein
MVVLPTPPLPHTTNNFDESSNDNSCEESNCCVMTAPRKALPQAARSVCKGRVDLRQHQATPPTE